MKSLVFVFTVFALANGAHADWSTALKCSSTDKAHPTLAVSMTLPPNLPVNGPVTPGATMAVSENGKGGDSIPALVTMNTGTTIGVMGQNGFACVVSQVGSAMNGSCGLVASGQSISISCN